jgi:hypothetical protein
MGLENEIDRYTKPKVIMVEEVEDEVTASEWQFAEVEEAEDMAGEPGEGVITTGTRTVNVYYSMASMPQNQTVRSLALSGINLVQMVVLM